MRTFAHFITRVGWVAASDRILTLREQLEHGHGGLRVFVAFGVHDHHSGAAVRHVEPKGRLGSPVDNLRRRHDRDIVLPLSGQGYVDGGLPHASPIEHDNRHDGRGCHDCRVRGVAGQHRR